VYQVLPLDKLGSCGGRRQLCSYMQPLSCWKILDWNGWVCNFTKRGQQNAACTLTRDSEEGRGRVLAAIPNPITLDAGASSSVACSLCQAGSYLTSSGVSVHKCEMYNQ